MPEKAWDGFREGGRDRILLGVGFQVAMKPAEEVEEGKGVKKRLIQH